MYLAVNYKSKTSNLLKEQYKQKLYKTGILLKIFECVLSHEKVSFKKMFVLTVYTEIQENA